MGEIVRAGKDGREALVYVNVNKPILWFLVQKLICLNYFHGLTRSRNFSGLIGFDS